MRVEKDFNQVLRDACPKDGDRFYLPEFVTLESIGYVDANIAKDASVVCRAEGDVMVGHDGHVVKFNKLSIEDQRHVVSIVDEALHSPDIAIDELPDQQIKPSSNYVTMYQGKKAKEIVSEILAKPVYERYPLHAGAKGFYADDEKFVAFDNCSTDCWVEEFYTKDSAIGWCSGAFDTAQANDRPEEKAARKEYLFRESCLVVAERTKDGSARSFSRSQRDVLSLYLMFFKGDEQRMSAVKHVFDTAMTASGMKSVYAEWKEDVWEELSDFLKGQERSQGLSLK